MKAHHSKKKGALLSPKQAKRGIHKRIGFKARSNLVRQNSMLYARSATSPCVKLSRAFPFFVQLSKLERMPRAP